MRFTVSTFALIALFSTASAFTFGRNPFATSKQTSQVKQTDLDSTKATLDEVKKDAADLVTKVNEAEAKAGKFQKDAAEVLKKAKEDAARFQQEAKNKSPEYMKKANDKATRAIEDAKRKAASLQEQAKKVLSSVK